jgi:hypothetical protein
MCPDCLSYTAECLRGVGESRGEAWAASVARRRPDVLTQPWPDDERARAMARGKLADISSDPRLAGLLVDRVQRGAVRAWEQLRANSRVSRNS